MFLEGHGTMKWHLNEKLITLEIENQQLEDELFKLQLQRQKNNRIPKTTNGGTFMFWKYNTKKDSWAHPKIPNSDKQSVHIQ